MNRKQLLTCASALVLSTGISAPNAFADNTTGIPKPKFVEASSSDQATKPEPPPKLNPSTIREGAANPNFNLAQHLGLSPNSRIHVDGFISTGVTKTNSSVPYAIPGHGTVDKNWNFAANSLVGLQISADITKQLSLVTQLVANGDNTNGNTPYSVNLDWGYIKYQIIPQVTVRAGRFRMPSFMYSATQEIGYTYPWVTLPNEVYRLIPFSNINGVDSIITHSFRGWTVSLEPYVGTNTSKYDMYTSDTNVVPEGETADFSEHNILGGVISIGNKYLTLRGTYARLRLTGKLKIMQINAPPFDDKFLDNKEEDFYSVGAKLNYKELFAAAEFAHRSTNAPLAALTGLYAMLGLKFDKLLPNVTYGRLWTTNKKDLFGANDTANSPPTELAQAQQSVTGGLDYYMNSNIVMKGAVSWIRPMDGTRGLFNTTNPSEVKRNNFLYTVGVDAVF